MKNNLRWAAGVSTLTMVLALNAGCSSTPNPDGGGNDNGTDSDPVSFADDVQPILTNQCIVCHQPGGIAFADGINQDLRADSAYDAIVNQPSDRDASLTLVVPGDAENSFLFQKVSSDTPLIGVRMPQFQLPLSAAQIDMIHRWIDEGALDN